MKTIKLTQADFKNGVYCGKESLIKIEGNLEIEATGSLQFESCISAEGYIIAKGGIIAKGNIIAGGGIIAESYISAGGYISAKGYIIAKSYISAESYIIAKGGIIVEGYIIAEGDIIAGGGVLKALYGITAGEKIYAKTEIECGMRIFAGTAPYFWVGKEQREIKCGKLISGEVAYGDLIETGLDEGLTPVACVDETIEINGKKYKRV